jgi:hypothetical protein
MSAAIATCYSILSVPAFADGKGNGAGNGNSAGNSNGGAGGAGNAGGNGKSNAGGTAKGGSAGRAALDGVSEGTASVKAFRLRESGEIHPLADAYAVAERQFGGEVIDATLEQQSASVWRYDLRVVSDDGRVRTLSYDAATLSLISVDGEPLK